MRQWTEWPLVTASGLKSGWARDRRGPQAQ